MCLGEKVIEACDCIVDVQLSTDATAHQVAGGVLKVETVALAKLALDPRNARRHPERNLESIKASLARFGQQKPIVVDADGVTVAGNGTRKWTMIP